MNRRLAVLQLELDEKNDKIERVSADARTGEHFSITHGPADTPLFAAPFS